MSTGPSEQDARRGAKEGSAAESEREDRAADLLLEAMAEGEVTPSE